METVDNHKTLSHYTKDTDGRTSVMCSMGEITLDNQRTFSVHCTAQYKIQLPPRLLPKCDTGITPVPPPSRLSLCSHQPVPNRSG